MSQPVCSRRRVPLSIALAAISITALLACRVDVARASAPVSIERVWSFNGGAVDIVGQPNGTLIGVVTAPTKFAKCVHPIDEQIWIEMRRQPDGSYWGLHRWYFEPPGCVPNPSYGPTAWRVLQNAKGESYLKVCFSEPLSKSQPTIAPDGTVAHATYGCAESISIAPLPVISAKEGSAVPGSGQVSFGQVVKLPSAKMCVSRHTLTITLHHPKYDPLKEVVIRVNGKKVLDIRGVKKLKKSIVLKHLPSGTFKVQVLAITVLNQRLSGSRTYNSCTKGSGHIKLKGPKGKHKRHK